MKKIISILIFTLVLTSVSFAEIITRTYYFDEPVLTPDSIFTRIEITDGVVVGTPGYPALPYRGISFLLPQNENITNVLIEKGNEIDLGEHIVYPIQRSVPISDTSGYEFTEPDPDIYGSSEPFPAKQNTDFSTHYLAGYSVGFLAITPFSYIPVTGELYYFESITVTVETAFNEAAETAANKFLFKNPQIDKRLKILVENYDDKDAFYNITKERPDSAYDYIIVTSEEYSDDFQPLADFHSRQGYQTKIELIGYILINYTGFDNQDKLRNYFIDQYSQSPFQFVLLGGDSAPDNPSENIIPHRGLFADLGVGLTEYDIPADMYYSCLDRTLAPGSGPDWNNDNDDRWGEPNEADLLAEFYIGRICVNNSTDISNFINKTILYSENPVADEVQSALLVGEKLCGPPQYPTYTWGGTHMNELIGGCGNNGYTTVGIPLDWYISTLYDMNGIWDSDSLFTLLSLGPNILCHDGHSNVEYCMKIYNSDLTTSNIRNNGINHNFFNGYTHGCYSGSFDNRKSDMTYVDDCFAEKISTMPTAATTFVANSRYGLFYPGGTNGPSQIFHREWIDVFFDDEIFSIAGANQKSKEHAIPFIESDVAVRYCCYELNAFGDPALELWTDYPDYILATYHENLFLGEQTFEITGANCDTGRVALHFNNEIIAKGDLSEGKAVLTIFNPPADTGTATLSIWSHNYYLYEDEIPVIYPAYVVLDPNSILINQQTEVTVSVYQINGTPFKSVNVEVYGPGVFGDVTSGITDDNGVCVLNFGADYGGDEFVRIRGWKPDDYFYLFDEAIVVTGGLDLTNPDLTVTSYIGLCDTFAINFPGILHSYVEEESCMLWARVNNNDWQSTTEDSMEIIPEESGTVTGIITKSRYNIYAEEFPILEEVYGTVSGVVCDTNGVVVQYAQIKICTIEGDSVIVIDSLSTDSNGHYESCILFPVGEYLFMVDMFGYEHYEETHLIGYGDNTIDLEIVSFETWYTVEGMITFENGDPGIATVKIYKNDDYCLIKTLECISYGSFALFYVDLVNYTYLFKIEAHGYEVLDTVVVIEEDMTILFELEPHDYVRVVPDEYPTIQEAINHSYCVDGDTILVLPGTYSENVNYIGKNITVASLFLTTQDTSYISQTVIDGGSNGSVVTFENGEDTNAILSGLTITQGSGRLVEKDGEIRSYGGGIYSLNSTPSLSNLIIRENVADIGAGICVDWDATSSPVPVTIKSCLITADTAYASGGGIFVSVCDAEIINCSLTKNYSVYKGGAIGASGLNMDIVNCILWDNSQQQGTFCYFALGVNDTVTISYSDIEDGEAGIEINGDGTLIWGDGNITTNPLFADDYSLAWNDTVRSPCIDTGNPNTVWDEDNTPPDMGSIPAITHNYDCRILNEGWNWFSFPVLDTLSPQADTALTVLALILSNLEEVLFESYEPVIWWNPQIPGWQNDIGDFRSVDGYKIQMNAQDTLPISGFLEDSDAVITLEAEAEYGNWIGYFLGYSQMPHDAFAEVWDTLTYIKAEDWAMFKKQGQWWGAYGTVDYGKSYVVGCSDDCSFTWGFGLQKDPYTKSETIVFFYQEQADYMPIFVDSTEAVVGIDEIGVFLGDECIGASVVEGFPVFIPAYSEDEDSIGTKDYGELTFQVATYSKNEKRIIPAFVYHNLIDAFVKEPIILDNKSYAIVRLGTGAGIEFPKEFTLYQNYPNPIISSTTISFIPSPEAENSEIKIYNIKGQLVKKLEIQNTKGKINRIEWSGKDNNGRKVGNGIYFYKVISGKKSAIKKMVLLR